MTITLDEHEIEAILSWSKSAGYTNNTVTAKLKAALSKRLTGTERALLKFVKA